MITILHIALLGVFLITSFINPLMSNADSKPEIAKWLNNKTAAISLRFDDNLESHVETVIPLLNEFGFNATFMVNPGRANFKKYEHFWSVKVPEMGHDLGNHTMNHKGAKTVNAAGHEIGAASRYIWRCYPENSKLLAFASGGGEKWGGKRWSEADDTYKVLVEKFFLIDLYDGNHPSVGVEAGETANDLFINVSSAIQGKYHQPFSFHTIGTPTIKDRLIYLLKRYTMAFPTEEFRAFLQLLDNERDRLWIAPLTDILKYQEEYQNSYLSYFADANNTNTLKLTVNTDRDLYDIPLTIILPLSNVSKLISVFQDDIVIENILSGNENIIFNVKPFSSKITLNYLNKD